MPGSLPSHTQAHAVLFSGLFWASLDPHHPLSPASSPLTTAPHQAVFQQLVPDARLIVCCCAGMLRLMLSDGSCRPQDTTVCFAEEMQMQPVG